MPSEGSEYLGKKGPTRGAGLGNEVLGNLAGFAIPWGVRGTSIPSVWESLAAISRAF
jgi:hypothetical protein